MSGFPFGQSYAPQMHVHMFHCTLKDPYFRLGLIRADVRIRVNISATATWYSCHQDECEEILALREIRLLPPSKTYVG